MKFSRGSHGYIPCNEIIGFLYAYLDGELAPADRAEFDRHLAVCPSCVAYLETYRTTVSLERAALEEPGGELEALPRELTEAVLAALARAKQG